MAGSSPRRFPTPRPPLSATEINDYLSSRLREYNDRDADAIQKHIGVLCHALESDVDEVIRPLFGGSIGRHTYVDGLSDIDVLMVINESALSDLSPSDVLRQMAELIKARLPTSEVSVGSLAVTISYSDGHEIQALPAIKSRSGIRIATPSGENWSGILHPERFAEKLTSVNQSTGGRLVPTVKLVKALADRSVQSNRGRLTGYHIESLAIDAFEHYRGPRDLKSMLSRFLTHASGAVLRPMKDTTGQSRHVDEYLGPADSGERQRASSTLKRLERSVVVCKTRQDLDTLFDP